ncbi:hypothetical protein TNCV_41921 [Trichonephila clavipes]|nr:hypothetical protein TNCV_41921 [Trichonephila clavipes]
MWGTRNWIQISETPVTLPDIAGMRTNFFALESRTQIFIFPIATKLESAVLRKYDLSRTRAFSSIVTLLDGGQTAHFAFMPPLDIHKKLDAMCTTEKKVGWGYSIAKKFNHNQVLVYHGP